MDLGPDLDCSVFGSEACVAVQTRNEMNLSQCFLWSQVSEKTVKRGVWGGGIVLRTTYRFKFLAVGVHRARQGQVHDFVLR